jgi:hypothetical protein
MKRAVTSKTGMSFQEWKEKITVNSYQLPIGLQIVNTNLKLNITIRDDTNSVPL